MPLVAVGSRQFLLRLLSQLGAAKPLRSHSYQITSALRASVIPSSPKGSDLDTFSGLLTLALQPHQSLRFST